MQEQNQNSIFQPQVSAISAQTQTATVPETSTNTAAQNAGGIALFSDNTNTGSLLNQTQVLGTTTSASQTTAAQTTAFEPKSNGLPVGHILIGLVILLVLAWFFRRKDAVAVDADKEESD